MSLGRVFGKIVGWRSDEGRFAVLRLFGPGCWLLALLVAGEPSSVRAATVPPTYLVSISSSVETVGEVTGFQLDAYDGGIAFSGDGSYRVFRGSPSPWPAGEIVRPVDYALATPFVLGRYRDNSVKLFGPLDSGDGLQNRWISPPGPLSLRAAGRMGSNVVVLQTDGTVVEWCPGCSLPNSSLPVPLKPVAGVSSGVSLAVGLTHAVALRSDGTVTAWGAGESGQTQVPPGLADVMAVGAGDRFSAALRRDGQLVLWGDYPEPPKSLPPLKSFAVGRLRIVALGVDGSVHAWGVNTSQLHLWTDGLQSILSVGISLDALAILALGQPPVILKEPGSRLFGSGERLTLDVSVIHFGPTRYQWFLNDVAIPGETNASLTRYFIGSRQEGVYTATVSNRYGTRTTSPARMMLTDTLLLEPGRPGPVDVPRPDLLGPVRGAAVGAFHTVALRPDGTVLAWGGNQAGQCNVPPAVQDVVALAAGYQHTLALRRDGSVVAWGANDAGQCAVPPDLKPVTAVAAGMQHSVVLQSDGTVRAWGSQGFAEPAALRVITNAIAVCAGQEYTAVLRNEGTVSVFGSAFFGLLDPPSNLGPVRAIAGGSRHVAALQEDGRLRIWGDNSMGQTRVPENLTGIQTLVAGGDCTLVRMKDGTVRIIGSGSVINSSMTQVDSMVTAGERSAFVVSLPPLPVPPQLVRPPQPQLVHLGDEIQLDMEAEGSPVLSYIWYRNGRLVYRGSSVTIPADPRVAGDYTVKVFNRYGEFTTEPVRLEVLGRPAGRTYAWGFNKGFPVSATFETDTVHAVAVGNNFMVEARQDGTVDVRGDGSRGQTNLPANVHGVIAVSAGDGHVMALTQDGRVLAWGDNSRGQCSVPPGVSNAVAISAGWYHSLAVLSDGTVVGWGDNSHGEAQPPRGLNRVASVAAGMDFSTALRTDGSVVAWGDNSQGQVTGVWAGKDVQAVAAGAQHGLALLRDGNVVGWGRNDLGQRPALGAMTNAVFIAAADHYSLAIGRDGWLRSWGAAPLAPTYLTNEVYRAVKVAAGRYQALAVLPTPGVKNALEWDGARLKLKSWVSPGWRYRYEESYDLEHWVPSGPDFLAPEALLSEEVGLGAEAVYFRIREVP